ncbi:MAG: glycosyltransferase family 4 protein [Actinomycetota bacterium]
MRILISAYACEPGEGSEPEVGFQTVLAAAREHEVWVITRGNNVASLRSALSRKKNIHVIAHDVEGPALRAKNLGGLLTLHLYHDLWQRRLGELAVSLDREHNFDLIHHVTFAAYWSRAGVASVAKPLVWGPLGGGVAPPVSLLPAMGLFGAASDLTRVLVRPLFARMSKAPLTAEKADIILVQNHETARRIRQPSKTRLLPNGVVGGLHVEAEPHDRHPIVAAGRLIGWKGMALAISAMRHMDDDQVLDIYGEGPDRRRLERLARRRGVQERVRFRGRVPRDEVLTAIAGARVFLHPALHEDSGMAVAEALTAGTPVVCLDRGGPPVLLRRWPNVPSRVVSPSTPGVTARRLASALNEVADLRAETDLAPAEEFGNELLAIYTDLSKRAR